MGVAGRLRELLNAPGIVAVPGVYDCITARLVEQAGFSAVYMIGYPDYGLVTMSEMVDNAGRITAATQIPVVADAGTGYGNDST